ncbi:MAG: response regulator [Flavobacteriales bacterium]|nr:response regulator [Flavobacteriales bacterium]MCB9191434.1 response regulator [Flavobacteriales bacterium]MCB9203940.1 response regulator [Flavobacteriales bacterium]
MERRRPDKRYQRVTEPDMTKDRYVILVEDDPTVLHSLRLQMREILPPHYIIETANDGNEALEVLADIAEADGVVPLIVTDHQMPNMTGSEFLLQVKQFIPRCRNIMLTGEAGLTDITNLINEQALFRYISKPWTQSDLEMTVQSALDAFNQEYKLEKLNRKLQWINENLEEQVRDRTSELHLKTEELNSGLEFARLMQESLLPSKEAFSPFFQNVELLFRPHSRVSGDFYTFTQQSDTKAMVILGDATGHGIAGAFLSSICIGIIDNIVSNQILEHPKEVLAEILTRFRDLSSQAKQSMQQMVSVELTVVCLDKEENLLKYASNSKQLLLLKGGNVVIPREDSFQCCLGNQQTKQVLKHRGRTGKLPMDDLDTIVLFTDGVPDQFMSTTGKKLGRKGLLSELRTTRSTELNEWFGQIQGKEPNTDDATMLILKF